MVVTQLCASCTVYSNVIVLSRDNPYLMANAQERWRLQSCARATRHTTEHNVTPWHGRCTCNDVWGSLTGN